MPTERPIKTLKINKLTQAQYDSISKNPDELYLTPDNSISMPTIIALTDTTYTLTIAENTIYDFSNAVTSLTISSVPSSYLESLIYFTTGSSISFTDNSTLKWGGGSIPSLDINTTYCIAIKNGLAELDKFGR